MRNKINIIAGIILLFFVFTGCKNETKKSNQDSQSVTLEELTVGVHSWPGGGMIYIGDKLGYFKDEGIDLKIKKIENFDTKRSSLIGGTIDIDVANTMDQLVIYGENSFPAQVIGVSDESVGGDGLVGKEGITSLKDLEGKTVAFAEASPSDFFLRYILSKNGVDISKVKLKPVADPQIAGNAVIAGQVDAAVTYEPYLSQAEDTKGLKMISSTKDYPTLIPGLLIANGDKVSKQPELYVKFLRAWFKSVDYYNSNREDAYSIISEGMGMDIAEVKDILSVVDIENLKENQDHFDKAKADDLYELVESISLFWKENGFTTKSSNAEQLVNSSIISKVK
jgi:NitT/TauT family transport system substrate-binding protein